MKIGILTFHCAINYGAVLQAYGLQEVLKSMGHDVYIIDYRPDYLKRPYRLFFPEAVKGRGFLGNILSFIRELLALPIRYKRKCAFKWFIEKHLHLSKLDLQDGRNDFDCFVFGSDQIWNPQLTGGDSVFFGDAICFNRKRLLTYAASAGDVSFLKDIDENCLKRWLKNFSSLSVREKSLSDFLLEELHVESQLVIDPVLLAGKNVFNKITSSKQKQNSYLLFFSLTWNDKGLNFARRYAELHNLEIIEIYSMKICIKDKNVLQSLSPEEFIGYFKHAKFVITPSFHGTIFSILFHIPFITLSHDFGKSRFFTLLNMFGLCDRLIETNNVEDLELRNIDWNFVDKVLSQKRKDSISFLKSHLNDKL